MIKALIIFGTRPEAIKLAPVIKVLNSDKRFNPFICSTGQHREMLQQVLDIFKIKLDYDLDLMKKNQDLFDISSRSLLKLKNIIRAIKPSILIVQGDTSTAFISALAAFYSKVRIAHIEAGLRSYNILSPYPEEANRRFISIISNIHFAPTKESRDNLIREGISKNKIFVTGNTVIDALFEVKKQISAPLKSKKIHEYFAEYLPSDFFGQKFILITMHRREKFGKELEVVLRTLKKLARNHKELNFVYPVHLNPNVQAPVHKLLGNQPNVYLIPPQDYINFIYLMSKCYFLLSDSGGVQEECYVFKKPIIVLRDVTERNEAVRSGYAFLSGNDPDKIEKYFRMIYNRLNKTHSFFRGKNPFGDGHASSKILKILTE